MKPCMLILITVLGLTGCSSEPIQVEVKHEHKIKFERQPADPNSPRPLQELIDQIKANTKPSKPSP